MKPVLAHSWKLSLEAAEELQKKLSRRLIGQAPFKTVEDVKTVAALDVNYGQEGEGARAAALVFRLPSLEAVESVSVQVKSSSLFPYVPGLFSFREIPPLLSALKKLKNRPDVFLLDGQGLAHPRRFGLACHLGLIMDTPSIGCADTWLFGDYEEPPPGLAGAYTFLRNGDEPIGAALRSQPYSKAIFVSPGHRMGILMAVDIVMSCVRENRIPQPLRRVKGRQTAPPPAPPTAAGRVLPSTPRAEPVAPMAVDQLTRRGSAPMRDRKKRDRK